MSLADLRCTSLRITALTLAVLGWAASARAQAFQPNYDEAQVPAYVLPDPLVDSAGKPVADHREWTERRRSEILASFESQMYGKAPARPTGTTSRVERTISDALGGKATRKEVTIFLTGAEDGPRLDLMIYLPSGAKTARPVFLGLNFGGNHAVDPDPRIPLARWVANDQKLGISDHKPTEQSRGSEASRWSLAKAIDRGYAVATACYHDIDPDFDDGFRNGVQGALDKPGDAPRAPDAWGSVAAWAWGLSRALDHLTTDRDIDADRVVVMGHSRLGKAALWAGATDPRFALVVSNDSGEGGAALARRRFGETTRRINTAFPHWFCGNYKQFNDREDAMPFDQHMLIALIAPRPVLIHSATEDLWADPRGEFLSAQGADSVFRMLGTDGLAVRDMPGPGVLVFSRIGYFLRPGKHDVTDADWEAYLDFADRQLGLPSKP